MKILSVTSLSIPEVKIIRYAFFNDNRGYFTETFRKSDFFCHDGLNHILNVDTFAQVNESHSKKKVVRGLHFQWNPYMGKLVRTIQGHMVDLVLDIRIGSPTFGKIIAYDMPVPTDGQYGEWIYVPVGFAHGNFYLEESSIEYFCTSEYNPGSEAGISPVSPDIDWSLCDENLKIKFEHLIKDGAILSDKDKRGYTLKKWQESEKSKQFMYAE